jgi:hypothetical protein
MDAFFRAIESSSFSVWLRESTSVFAYPAFLSAHAIGMGLVVGVNVAVALHLLGVTRGLPTRELHRFAPVLWVGFAMNAASGVLLLVAYPTKALTNPVFYVKLALIALGTWLYIALDRRVQHETTDDASDRATASQDYIRAVSRSSARALAAASLAAWAAAITAGRLLAYTYHRLFVDF